MMIVDSVLLKVGIVGTGYAARKRAEALKSDPRTELLVATGNTPVKLQEFCQTYAVSAVDSWSELVNLPQLDLIFICTINQGCGAIAKAAILAGKHVVVEYPLALEVEVAQEVIELAAAKQKLLHVEHIEIIGGLHQALKQYLPQIGKVFHASYTTIAAQHPVEPSWKYHRQQFGFPLSAALSRIHRLTDLFGTVEKVSCDNRYWNLPNSDSAYFTACFCQAQLSFHNGITADITYGKGDIFWQSDRTLEIYGEAGKIRFKGEKGTLINAENEQDIPVTPRRGLFAQDTAMVLDYLLAQKPLYLQPQASLYALKVANAARESSSTKQTIYLD
ncbi:MAG: Gfo/Idh/MocA family oxidoreductase [Pleurocapsa minor HA4230-MV1]|jgi:biliverdin reductase|nr:Gfo/Idh/MocA family oxidoreductase [Pleurocapsa minor HA4230-MV1]